jgi:glycosyltransferase involved in cell wall biosynthesis
VVTTPPGGRRTAGPVSIEIIVPAHNEARRLPAGLATLCRKAAQLPLPTGVLVVDSASSDGTADVVRDWPEGPVPVRLLRSDQPGKGRAVRLGLLATRAPFVGFCDADMATDLSALDLTLSLLAAGAHVVIGSRALEGSVVEERHSAIRRMGAAAFRCLARRIVPGVSDTQCGFKFFSGPLARAAARPLRTTGFAFDIELIARCQRLGAALTEIPVTWRDVPGSTFSVSRHSAGTVRDLAAIWLHHRPARPPFTPAPLPGPLVPAVPPPGRPAAVTPA